MCVSFPPFRAWRVCPMGTELTGSILRLPASRPENLRFFEALFLFHYIDLDPAFGDVA